MTAATVHSVQMLDGGDVFVQVAALALPNRVIATRDLTTGILSYVNQPPLWVSGPTSGKLIELVGSNEFNASLTKNNKEFRLFNDSGWTQDKITGRGFQITGQGMFVRNIDPLNPDLDDSFKIIFANAQEKEEEVYVKFRKILGVLPAGAPVAVTAATATDELTFTSAHGLFSGASLTISAGTLPAPLVAATKYYAIVTSPTTIKVAASYADATATTPVPIDITSAGATVTTIRSARKRFLVEGGNCKVLNFSDQAMADGILQVSFTFKGQGAYLYGFDEDDL
jgi:hypothetical protein